jgi:hypothetical protein
MSLPVVLSFRLQRRAGVSQLLIGRVRRGRMKWNWGTTLAFTFTIR